MKVGVCPTKYGYTAVCLPPFGSKDWVIYWPEGYTPEPDLLMMLVDQIQHKLATYVFRMTSWTNTLPVFLMWALWGGIALYLRLSTYWSYGWQTVLLYGWIMFLFFGDGIFSLGRTMHQVRNLIRARRVRKNAAQPVIAHAGVFPLREIGQIKTEREYIKYMGDAHPKLRPYYEEMVRKREPEIFSWYPLGLIEIIRWLFCGPRIPRPEIIIELGTLDVEAWE